MNVADRITAKQDAKLPPRRSKRLVDMAGALYANASKPIITLGFPQLDSLVQLMTSFMLVLQGGSGSGKSTFAFQVATRHALTAGPVLVVTPELSAEELAARAVSRESGVTWFQALRGEASKEATEAALAVDRLYILDGRDATIRGARIEIQALKRDYPGLPIVVVIDYLQILEAEGKDERERMKNAVEGLRALAKAEDVFILLMSQTSRAAATALRKGEMTGIETMSAGAESGQIERAAYATLTLGAVVEAGDDEPVTVEVSIGKNRMGRSNKVLPMAYDGRRGLWSEAGELISATKLKAERDEEKTSKAVVTVAHAIVACLTKAKKPMTRADLREELGGDNNRRSDAIKQLLTEDPPRVVEVAPKTRGWWSLWTPENAERAGVTPVPKGVDL